jgi:hypothetical protein
LPPDLHLVLTSDSATAPPAGSQIIYRVTATTANVGSASGARLIIALPAEYTVTKTYTDRGAGCTTDRTTVTCDLGWISPGIGTNVIVWGTTRSSGELDATATVTSLVEPEANPADNITTLKLLVPAPPAPTSAVVELERPPKIARSGRALRVVPPTWTAAAQRLAFQWQRCTRTCVSVRGATRATFTVRRTGRIRVVATPWSQADGWSPRQRPSPSASYPSLRAEIVDFTFSLIARKYAWFRAARTSRDSPLASTPGSYIGAPITIRLLRPCEL